MKRIIVFVAVLVVTVAVIDYIAGAFLSGLERTDRLGGDFTSISDLVKKPHDGILILGSSVALNGLNPNTIGDSMKVECYNGGANGQLMPFYETALECVMSHDKKPQVVLLGLTPHGLSDEGNGNRFNMLMPFYKCGYPAIDRKFDEEGAVERSMLHSALYRYNIIWFRLLLYQFVTPGVKGENGFTGKPVPRVFPILANADGGGAVSDQRKKEIGHFAALCKKNGVKLIVFFPPSYEIYRQVPPTVAYLADFCRRNGVLCFDDYRDSFFLKHKELFYDAAHLNINGCEKYTEIMIERLRRLEIL